MPCRAAAFTAPRYRSWWRSGNSRFAPACRPIRSKAKPPRRPRHRRWRGVLDGAVGTGKYRIDLTEAIGPKVGRELQSKAIIAILVSFIGTLIYVAFRFEWRFGVAAVLGTAHDLVAALAFIMYLRLEVSLVLVAAILTVKGYSLNDKIVIADRVRENLRKYRRDNLYGILNRSVNETIPRTILTGGTTLATTLVLSFLAGEVIRPFALVMSFGIIMGTLSSMFIAPHILLSIEQRWPGQDARGARALASTPSGSTRCRRRLHRFRFP